MNEKKRGVEKRIFKGIFIGVGVTVLLIVLVGLGYYRYHKTRLLPIDLVKRQASPNPSELINKVKGDITIHGYEVEDTEKPNTYLVS